MMMSGNDFLKSHVLNWRQKGVFRLGRCYILCQGASGLWASEWESMVPMVDCSSAWHAM